MPGSMRGVQSYTLTFFEFRRLNLWKLWIASRGGPKSLPHDAFHTAILTCDEIWQRVACRWGASSEGRKHVTQFSSFPLPPSKPHRRKHHFCVAIWRKLAYIRKQSKDILHINTGKLFFFFSFRRIVGGSEDLFILHHRYRECTFGGVYVSCIHAHARWSYGRWFGSLLLCPLSVERYYFPLFGYSLHRRQVDRTLQAMKKPTLKPCTYGSVSLQLFFFNALHCPK